MSSTAPAPTDGPPIGRWLSSGLILTSCGFWYLFLVTRASWLSVRAQGCTADLLDAGGMFAHRLEVLGVAGVVWLLSLPVSYTHLRAHET